MTNLIANRAGKLRDRWQRKGSFPRITEMVVMGVVASLARAACEYFEFNSATTKAVVETASMIVSAYMAKLLLPTEK